MPLPTLIPLFPLPNVVLFPHVLLPLHIFEPRYRRMVHDIPTGEGLIGMILFRSAEDPLAGGRDVYSVGCAGRMIRKVDLPDGRSNILLQGVREFTPREQYFTEPYRTAAVEWRPAVARDFRLDAVLRERLKNSIRGFVQKQQESGGLRILDDPTVTDETLVNLFAFALDFPVAEKQSLLEIEEPTARAVRLLDTLEFHDLERECSPAVEASKFRVQ
ncbi:MAG: LON peptidase substrate-binding domain-containing protein [Candidatus Binatia bacterium]